MDQTSNEFRKGKEAINWYLTRVRGDDFDKSDFLYSKIESCSVDEQPKLLRYLCEVYDIVDSMESHDAEISEYADKKDSLESQYGDIVNSLIKSFIGQASSEDEFYELLWQSFQSAIFDTEAKRVFALYYTLIDRRIPFFKLDETCYYSMSNDRYRELRQKTTVDHQRIRFLLTTDVDQRTERASLLLSEFGIRPPETTLSPETEQYEQNLMRMVYILNEKDSEKNRVVSLLMRR